MYLALGLVLDHMEWSLPPSWPQTNGCRADKALIETSRARSRYGRSCPIQKMVLYSYLYRIDEYFCRLAHRLMQVRIRAGGLFRLPVQRAEP